MTVKRILFLPENDSLITHNVNCHEDVSQEYLIENYVANLLDLNHIDDIKTKTIFVGKDNIYDRTIELLYRDDKDLTSNKHIPFMKGPICIVSYIESCSFENYTYDYVDFDRYLTLKNIIKILHIERRIEINNTLLINIRKRRQQLSNEYEELLQAK